MVLGLKQTGADTMTNKALDKCLAQIGDAFRPERKERQTTVISGHRVKALVEAGRYRTVSKSRK
jgi:hypothetical protein